MTTDDTLRLRPARSDDLALLRRWDAQPHVRAATGGADWEWESELTRTPPWRAQCIAELNGRPIGYVEIIDPAREETRYWGAVPAGLRALDIWIGEADALGKGHGTQIMRLALARCFADPQVQAVLVDPLPHNERARRFYERLGFRYVERRRFVDGESCVYRLDRATWEGSG